MENEEELELVYDGDIGEDWGSYSPTHISDECDNCLKNVGLYNLNKVPFIYHDCNDNMHSDVLYPTKYRQYYVCDKCIQRC